MAIIMDKKYEKLDTSKVLSDDGSGAGISIPSVLIGNDNGKKLRDYYMKNNPESELKGHIVELFDDSFNSTVMESEDAWVIEFYDPHCPHCKKFAPTYEQVANDLKGLVKVGTINGRAERDLMTRFSITGYPTIKAFGYGINSKDDSQILSFKGARSEEAVMTFGKKLISTVDKADIK